MSFIQSIVAGTTNTEAGVKIYSRGGANDGLAAGWLDDGDVDATNVKTALDNVDGTECAEVLALLTSISGNVFDTASKKVEFSDQDPSAKTFSNLKEEYTLNPTLTGLNNTNETNGLKALLEAENDGNAIEVLDQYGVSIAGAITIKVNAIVENDEGYAENNFKVTDNDKTTAGIVGVERGDTFNITLVCGSLSETVPVAAGADVAASIVEDNNLYRGLVDNYLEPQRVEGLD